MSEKKKKVTPKKEGISCVGMIAVFIFIILILGIIGYSRCMSGSFLH